MELQGLTELPVQREHRVQGRHRLLKDHRHFRAPNTAHIVHVNLQDVLALKEEFSTHNFSGRVGDQAHQRQGAHALAAAAFTHKAKGFSLLNLVRNPVNRLNYTFKGVEIGSKVFDFQKCSHLASLRQRNSDYLIPAPAFVLVGN